jgi:two-component system, OmpR family, response regulator CpxR
MAKQIVDSGYNVVRRKEFDSLADFEISEGVDLVIVSQKTPLNYLKTCRLIRNQSVVPILVLGDCSDTLDMVAALEMGADDFVALPTNDIGLVARIRALIRRHHLLQSELMWSRIIG